MIGLYVHLVFFTPPAIWALLECALLGCVIAAIGFNVMHDGAHGSFSRFAWVNRLAAYTLGVLGGSPYMWNSKHNLIHHTYTNIEGHDDDINIQPWMRMTPDQPKHPLHRYQHFYFWALYCMLYTSWIFAMDYQKYFSRQIGAIDLKPMNTGEHVSFWGFQGAEPAAVRGSAHLYGGLPALAGRLHAEHRRRRPRTEHGVPAGPHRGGCRLPRAPCAITSKLEDEWAIHQVRTTANFATDNKLVSWLVGGLNFQIEHHLFPKISHVHYPAISKIVQQVCAEFDVTYNNYKHTRTAIASHVLFLRQMGRAA